ncbi:MAG: metallophosphoesterase [Elusimicrobia bacterium]|nr:metallophosphoesterase [Elusimicrobiota bacterium]
MNRMHFLFFFLIFLSIYLGVHYYVYSRIASGLLLSSKACKYLRLFFLFASLSFILGEFLSRRMDYSWVEPVALTGVVWFGVIFIAVTVFLIADILRIFFHSESFRYYSVIFSLITVFFISAFSVYNAAVRRAIIKEIEIKLEKLPKKLSGFSIVQLSDLHLNLLKSEKWLCQIVSRTNELNPDIIVITGDLMDSELGDARGFCSILKGLKSKYGVYAVSGNHEFYAGYDRFLDIAGKSDITVLKNEKITIAGSIELVGIDDETGRRFSEPGSDLEKAFKNCDLKKPIILLSHQPDVFDKAVEFGTDLQLSGHTHAGQIPPLDLIVQFYFKYPYGLYCRNSSYIYTTAGTSTWGPPMRLFTRNEIIKFILKK